MDPTLALEEFDPPPSEVTSGRLEERGIGKPSAAELAALSKYWTELGYAVRKIDQTGQGTELHLQAQLHLGCCPQCGSSASGQAAPALWLVNDLQIDGLRTTLHIHGQAAKCEYCRGILQSLLPGIERDRRTSQRLAAWLATQLDHSVEALSLSTGVRMSAVREIVQSAAEARYGRREGPIPWFDLPGTSVTHYVVSPRGYDIYLCITNRPVCPSCGSTHVEPISTQRRHVHDRPHDGRRVSLVVPQLRFFQCKSPDCRRRFIEPIPGTALVPRSPRITQRAVDWILAQRSVRSKTQLASDCDVLVGTIRRILRRNGPKAQMPAVVDVPGWIALPDMQPVRYEVIRDVHHVHVRALMREICASCGSTSVENRWRRSCIVHDLPLAGKPTLLHWRGLIMRCADCGHIAQQSGPSIGAAQKCTPRLAVWIGEQPQRTKEELIALTGLRSTTVLGLMHVSRARAHTGCADAQAVPRFALFGYRVEYSVLASDGYHAYLQPLERVFRCPRCSNMDLSLSKVKSHDILDRPIDGCLVQLHVAQPVFRCNACGAWARTKLPGVRPRLRLTRRLEVWIHERLKGRATAVEIAAQLNVSVHWVESVVGRSTKSRH